MKRLIVVLMVLCTAQLDAQETPDQRASYIQGSMTAQETYGLRVLDALAAGDTAQAAADLRQMIGRARAARTHTLTLREILRALPDYPDTVWVEVPVEPSDTVWIESPDTVWRVPGDISARATDCTEDLTSDIMDWLVLVPDNSNVLFTPGCYNVTAGGLALYDRHGLNIDGGGATFKINFINERKRSHFMFTGGSGHTVRNFRLIGGNDNGGMSGTYISTLVAQHGVEFKSTKGPLLVEDVHVSHVFGDCLYAGNGSTAEDAVTDLVVRRLTCSHTGRHGAAFTNNDGVLLEDSHFEEIRWSGLDVEPGIDGLLGRNIEFRGNTFSNIRHYLITVGGKSGWPNVGRIAFNENVQLEANVTSTEPIRFSGVAANQGGQVRSHFEASRNRLIPYSGVARLANVTDVLMEDNWIDGNIGQSGYKRIRINDVHDAQFLNNNEGPAPVRVYEEGEVPSTGIVEVL